MRTITVISSKTGETKIEASGFSGQACLEATRRLENLLGGELTRQETAEMHAVEATTSVEATNG